LAARILNGNQIREEIYIDLRQEIAKLRAAGIIPGLAAILVGDNAASKVYVTSKIQACETLGLNSFLITPPNTITTKELQAIVKDLNGRNEVDAILVQLPLPKQVDAKEILDTVDPTKDVDGFHPLNVGKLVAGRPNLVVCTPLGIMVAAQAEYPFTAFEAGVVDYLLKPIAATRFAESLHRARQHCRANPVSLREPASRPEVPVTEAPREASSSAPQLLVGERERRFYVLKPEKIDYIESHGNYVKFHTGNTEYICRDSVKRLAPALAHSGFLRIERSLVINTHAIHYVQRMGRGTYAFTLVSGACLHSGAAYREDILRVLPLAQVPGARASH